MLQKKSIFFGLEKYSDRTAVFDQNEKKYSYKKLLKDSKLFNRFFLEKKLTLSLFNFFTDFNFI